jgi:subtilisin family serine protease
MSIRLLLLWAMPFSLFAQWRPAPTNVSPRLWETALREGHATAIVELYPQADLSGAAALPTKADKGRYVFEALRAAADNAPQRDLLRRLAEWGVPHRSFWLVNALLVEASPAAMEEMARHPVVRRLHADPPVRRPEPVRLPDAGPRGGAPLLAWGLSFMRVDSVWALGINGQGALIGGQDTGYDWDHFALRDNYAGWNGATADHHYHWHDAIHTLSPLNNDTTNLPTNNPCGLDVGEPCDDGSHGTHTMGTMAGRQDSLGNPIGVAPGARWIGCRNMERGWGSPSTYLECFEFFLAPTDLSGQNPDPARAPHVINNSWGCPPVEGCDTSNFALMDLAIENLRAAGVVVVVSAGNDGPACATVRNPAAIFEGSFSVGASDFSGQIAAFSSRGGVEIDGSSRAKPNVSAPGVAVYSSVPGNGYTFSSGTSMAGPHVAGLVALLISANPALAGQVEAIETIIEQSATPAFDTVDCSGVPGTNHPNNTYGWGIVDAVRAVQLAQQWTSMIPAAEAGQSGLWAAPNPFAETLRIEWMPTVEKPRRLWVYDAIGRNVFSVESPVFPLLVPAQDWPSGLYWIGTDLGGGKAAVKL